MARGRADDQPDVIRERLDQYAQQTAPLFEYYERQELLARIDGSGHAGRGFPAGFSTSVARIPAG